MPALSEGRGGSGFGMRHPANETDRTVGRRLRTLRLARGLSQSEFGTHLGVTYQQIQKYEAGTNRIAASRLFRAAALMHDEFPAYKRRSRAARSITFLTLETCQRPPRAVRTTRALSDTRFERG